MDFGPVTYIFGSVILVSLVSLIGVFTLSLKFVPLIKLTKYLVSFAVGALLGDVFIHLLPESFEGASEIVGIYVLIGIIFSFIIEKFIHWRHCHIPESKQHHHPVTYINLVGDGVHNLIDGIIIAGSYFISIPVGIATTIAVVLHEIPQEIGDFGVLISGGFSKAKALWFNFLSALTAIVGAIIGIILGNSESLLYFLIPFAAGNFLYIALADLIPEIHKGTIKTEFESKAWLQLGMIIIGIAIMFLLKFIE